MTVNERSAKDFRIIVKVDPELAELIPKFLQNRDADIRLMKEALEKGRYEMIERTGHGMKGAGSGFGFDPITEIGARIEKAAQQKEKAVIQKEIDELSNYVSRLEVTYE